jgi:hypothetical protein
MSPNQRALERCQDGAATTTNGASRLSKRAAIYYAICAQLGSEQKAAPDLQRSVREALALPVDGHNPTVAQANRTAARVFLSNVAVRLRADSPALDFKWTALDDSPLTDTLGLLVERIAENTELIRAGKDRSKKDSAAEAQ